MYSHKHTYIHTYVRTYIYTHMPIVTSTYTNNGDTMHINKIYAYYYKGINIMNIGGHLCVDHHLKEFTVLINYHNDAHY